MHDTHPDAEAAAREAILRLSHGERIERAVQLSEELRAVALSALRARRPDTPLLSLVEIMSGEPLRPASRAGPFSAP